ncbi:hypothetical protein [Kitasatospora sp. NPDC004289]
MSARNRRLPRHLSWPLRPNDVRAALGVGPAAAVDLAFDDRPWKDGTLLHVAWVPALDSGLDPLSCLRIRIAPTADAYRTAARLVMLGHAMPQFAAWTAAARATSGGWGLSAHSRSWRLAGRGVQHRDDERPYPEAG